MNRQTEKPKHQPQATPAVNPTEGTGNRYFPPFELVLKGLETNHIDFAKPRVEVSTSCLRHILGMLLQDIYVDEAWYLENNPDVRGAVLSGDVKSARYHFIKAGYFEGRLPHPLAFHSEWYFNEYKDLAEAFKASDEGGLRDHYLHKGYFEGRAGEPGALKIAENWRTRQFD